MTDRYAAIIDRAMASEDKTERDRVLAEYPDQARIVRGMMNKIGKRLTGWVAHGWDRPERNRRLAAIEPAWLRRRVEAMVRERFEGEK